MIKILHLTQTHVRSDSRVLREVNALTELPDVELTAMGSDLPIGKDAEAAPGVRVREFPFWSERRKGLPRPLRYAMLLAEINLTFVRACRKDLPDVVHCHDTMVLPAGAWLAGRGVTLIYDAHELESAKGGQSAVLSRATLWLERRCWPRIDALISVSPSIVDWYDEHLGRKPSLCVLNAPAQRAAIAGPSAGVRDRIGLPPDTGLAVYVGALESGRGIEEVLTAFQGSEHHVAFIGDGTLAESLRRHATEQANVHLLAPVPSDELVDFIRDADVGLCLIAPISLSDYYCLPNKLFEYAAADLRVVATPLPEVRRVVAELDLGVIAESEPDQIAAAVTTCIVDRRPAASVDRSRLAAYSWPQQAHRLRRFYETLLRRPVKPDPAAPAEVNALHLPRTAAHD